MDPIGFQIVIVFFPVDLVGTPAEAQVLSTHWYSEVTWAVDMITPKHSLHYRAQLSLWSGIYWQIL